MTDSPELKMPTPRQCFAEAADALRRGDMTAAESWRSLGATIDSHVKQAQSVDE